MNAPKPVSLAGYPYLFDRQHSNHDWFAALSGFEASGAPGGPTMARNWRMDPRVDREREAEMKRSGCFPQAGSPIPFDKAVRDYFVQQLCQVPSATSQPQYFTQSNAANLIPDESRPQRNHRLLHVVSLNSLLAFILNQSLPGKGDFLLALRDITGQRPPSAVTPQAIDQLADTIQSAGAAAVKRLARALSDALGNTEPHWWAAFDHEIEDLSTTTDWTQAARTLGLGHLKQGEWLIAWRYSPEWAGRLYRPTVAEANQSGFHYPSPPTAPYGITMPLTSGLPAVRELIHVPLKGETSHDACIGSLGRIEGELAQTGAQINQWLAQRRAEHGAYLIQAMTTLPQTKPWLQRHGITR